MTTAAPSAPATNRLGLTKQDYVGSKSTLCPGCGHDAITAQIIAAAWEMGLEGSKVTKLSGIGCSSKSPAYFLNQSWGFNSVHGRAAAIATGTALANKTLKNILVSGDGDSMSIGMGQLVHLIRRNVPVVYILEDNGVYGLTKGQFSATADVGSTLKHGDVNEIPPIDPCSLAIELGCGFVARSFSGNPKQLNAILKAAMAHTGCAIIDVISPCVTFNNHDSSTKSYKNAKDHDYPVHDLGFVQYNEVEEVEIRAGDAREVAFPDGSVVSFRAVKDDYDPTNKLAAMQAIHASKAKQEFLTGILYLDPQAPTIHHFCPTVDEPLATLPQARTQPGPEALERIMQGLM
ncbi:MAG: 2-oxoacid:ferredoxin oxidoreductase subunit beta [Acidobacteria bacterium]|nr:2-oxoacid:ferredoxin oxidoreductase subunit beta [Acidobacteriota bacterium]